MDGQDESTTSQLTSLKERIAREIRPLIGSIKEPEERFYALIALLREGWSDDLANEAFEAAKGITDPEEKVRQLQTLMGEVSYHERELEGEASQT